MNKRTLSFFSIAALSLLVAFPAYSKVFKIATLSPEGSSWMLKMRAGAKEIEQQTQGRVKFKFYSGGVMGDDQAVLRKIRIRQLQGGAVTAGSITHSYPDNGLYSQTMLFRSLDEVSYVRKKMDDLIINGLEKAGFVSFGIAEGGFAYIMSMKPIRTVDDVRKQKAWVPSAQQEVLEAAKAFKLSPIPLPLGDVLAGLQTNLINAVAAPPIAALALQWHTQVKYLTDMPLMYSYGQLVIDKRAFMRLSKPDQQTVRQIMSRIFNEIDQQNRIDNINAMAALRQQNISFITPSTEQVQEWRDYADKAVQQVVVAAGIDKTLWEMLNKHLRDYRAQQK